MHSSLTLLVLLCFASSQCAHTVERDNPTQILVEKLNNASTKCKQELNLSTETFKNWYILDTQDRKFQCYTGCVLEQIGVIKGKTYDWERHLETVEIQSIKQHINKCKGKVNEDRCELAHEIMSCLKVEAKKLQEAS